MLSEDRLRELLQGWQVSQRHAAPREDARRTELCLAWDEVEAHADGRATIPPWRAEHLRTCAWCLAAVAAWPRVSGVKPSEVEALRHWLHAQGGVSATVGRIGHDGRIELRLPSSGPDGAVTVAVDWAGRRVVLAEGESRHGQVVVAGPCAIAGLRDVTIPAAVVRVERLADA